ncbi:hypothetical protein RMSM_05096 [Rhodopirellula maiorica SM1]|uniref:Uncharacterized protein n=1 Tax=Rhodopirellula maiorica SM1 TaxID=1265738 RepID=M5RVJ5_9BACT|nr:hypothetical protein RMSM_05096 [Rhodopirellula maiorica SM1]
MLSKENKQKHDDHDNRNGHVAKTCGKNGKYKRGTDADGNGNVGREQELEY